MAQERAPARQLFHLVLLPSGQQVGLYSHRGSGRFVRITERLTRGPFRYQTYAAEYLAEARRIAKRPVKQAVISASALSLLYPQDGIDGYPHPLGS